MNASNDALRHTNLLTAPAGNWPFACRSAYYSGELGAHDGIGYWTVHLARHRSHEEQHMVSVHERLHQDLTTSTPWGLATSAAGSLSETYGLDHATFDDLFTRLTTWSTEVHESYATFFSVGPDPGAGQAFTLADDYADYYRAASQLAPSTEDWMTRALLADALMRAAMAPRSLMLLADQPFSEWPELVHRLAPESPDARLRLMRLDLHRIWQDHASWQRTQQDASQGRGYNTISDAVRESLAQIGLECMDQQEHLHLARQILAQFEIVSNEPVNYQIIETPQDPIIGDLEEHQRESLRIRDHPLQANLVTQPAQQWKEFAAQHPDLGLHTCIYWLRSDLLAKQFSGLPATEDSHQLAMLSVAPHVSAGGQVLAWIGSGKSGPDLVASIFADHGQKLIVVTSIASLADAPDGARSHSVAKLYALIDLPVLEILQRWEDQAEHVLWYSIWIDGSHRMYAFMFEIPENPGVIAIHLTSAAGRQVLLRWLAEAKPANYKRDNTWAEEHVVEVNALIQHLTASFWSLDQRAGHQQKPGP